MKALGVAAGILAFTALSYLQFPGHTWLQQDTQIYVPMLEHSWNPGVLRRDLLLEGSHLAFTLYDETALAARRLTGLGFHPILAAEQIVTRGLGIWGIYLMATALGLGAGPALLVAGIYALGATISGPAVLSLEIEPDPRGFAVPLLFLATGLVAHGRYLGAGIAGAAAFLIHPPTVYPFWALYTLLSLRPGNRRRSGLAALGLAIALLFVASRYQIGTGERQAFFSRLTPDLERLQRMRASYSWISEWARQWLPQYGMLCAVIAGAWWRLRPKVGTDYKVLLLGMPAIGILSVPLSWFLLEGLKWGLLPQVQPMRALLFVTVTAVFLAGVAGCRAAERGRWLEAVPWFLVAYLVPIHGIAWALPAGAPAAVILLLAVMATAAVWWGRSRPAAGGALLCGAACAAFLLIAGPGGVRTHPELHTPALEQLAAWARHTTAPDAMFLFPDAGRNLAPGVFRSEAMRAIYVDWKGGGQVNYLPGLGLDWWRRWQMVTQRPLPASAYRDLGIDYLVYRSAAAPAGLTPVFQNPVYRVYRVR